MTSATLLYQVHCEVDENARDEWLEYMDAHIPDVLATGCFDGATLFEKESDGVTFVVSYQTSADRFDHYVSEFASDLKSDHVQKFGARVRAYREILKPMRAFDVG